MSPFNRHRLLETYWGQSEIYYVAAQLGWVPGAGSGQCVNMCTTVPARLPWLGLALPVQATNASMIAVIADTSRQLRGNQCGECGRCFGGRFSVDISSLCPLPDFVTRPARWITNGRLIRPAEKCIRGAIRL